MTNQIKAKRTYCVTGQQPKKNLTGTTFGRLTVVEFAGYLVGRTQSYWRCTCQCGQVIECRGSHLLTGNITSCGCFRREKRMTHGRHGTPEYRSWHGMLQRCHDVNATAYPQYGGRGISVCDEWRRSFAAFIGDMGEKPTPRHSIDRIDNSGNYCKENCRWSTSSEQCSNTRRNRFIASQGMKMTIAQWARHTGLHVSTITNRLNSGWGDDACVAVRRTT